MFFRFLIFILIFFLSACAASVKSSQNNAAAKDNAELGLSYFKQGDIALAKHKLLLALQQAPHDPSVQDAMAYFLEETGSSDQAEFYYKKAIKSSPKSGAAHNNYGTFLCRQGHYSQAIHHFLMAAKDPQYLNTAKAYENAGSCALKIPDKWAASQYFRKALAVDPHSPTALLQMAQLSYNQKNYPTAKGYLQAYLNIAKSTPQTDRLVKKLILGK